MTGFGATLYTFSTQSDFVQQLPDTLCRIAAMGYVKVEAFLSDMRRAPEVFVGSPVSVCGAHTVPGDIADTDAVLRVLEWCRCSDICSSGPLEWNSRTPDDFRRSAGRLNAMGAVFAREGIRLHYHNHEFEFEAYADGSLPIELLAAELDPDCVTLCFDTGWPVLVGNDPVVLLRQLATRIGYVHLRDFAGRVSVPLGLGDIDVGLILKTVSELSTVRHIVVEQDPGIRDPADDMRTSREYLERVITSR